MTLRILPCAESASGLLKSPLFWSAAVSNDADSFDGITGIATNVELDFGQMSFVINVQPGAYLGFGGLSLRGVTWVNETKIRDVRAINVTAMKCRRHLRPQP